jgi:2-dehydropantoate 2-reductase
LEEAMTFTFLGAGAVGGFYAALLAREGYDVGVVARGPHLDAIRRDGIRIDSVAVGNFSARVNVESDPSRLGPADVVVFAVKTYSNPEVLPLLTPLVAPHTTVLTLQNGVDSAEEVAAAVGAAHTVAGATYIAVALESPGLIRQTGTHRRIVMGECTGHPTVVSKRVHEIATAMQVADIQVEAVADSRVPIWEKFVYLAPFAAMTAAAREPIGAIWPDPDGRAALMGAYAEVEAVARASGVGVAEDVLRRAAEYTDALPPSTRSSMLIDLSQGKPLEVESLPGSVVRRGRAAGVGTPMMAALYAVLKPHAAGRRKPG